MHTVCNNICALFSPTVENPSHSDFVHLRNMLIRSNMQDLKHTTHHVLYENYRINCLCKNPCLVNKKIIQNCLSQENFKSCFGNINFFFVFIHRRTCKDLPAGLQKKTTCVSRKPLDGRGN